MTLPYDDAMLEITDCSEPTRQPELATQLTPPPLADPREGEGALGV